MNAADELSTLVQALGLAAFRREGQDVFVPLAELPAWMAPLLTPAGGEGVHLTRNSFFLEHFLEEAEGFWQAGAEGSYPSAAWTEPALGVDAIPLQATALRHGERCCLVIAVVGKEWAENRAILQHAREGQLGQEALIREIEKKEILMHCIVHDLANPLTGVAGGLQMLELEELGPAARKLVEMALTACDRQLAMIRQILDVFSAENQALEAASLDPAQAPDVREVARGVLDQMALAFQRRGLRTALLAAPENPPGGWRVAGESSRLERIFSNLLENALRQSPAGTEVQVHLHGDGAWVEVEIDDAGRGVPEAGIPHLFKKLAPAAGGVRGKAGLGLYFCRITVERWGGEIGYRRGARGGACFWFRLRRIEG